MSLQLRLVTEPKIYVITLDTERNMFDKMSNDFKFTYLIIHSLCCQEGKVLCFGMLDKVAL